MGRPGISTHKKPRWNAGFDVGLGSGGNRWDPVLAGGLGFEPRLAESESAVLPLDDPPTKRAARLALAVLSRATGLVQTDLLALDFASVTGQQAGAAQVASQIFVVVH